MDTAEVLQSLALEQARDPEEIAADILAEGIARKEQTDECFEYWERLSPREQEVVALVCLGYTNKEIGEKLGISPLTVKAHVSNALRKFGVEKRGQILRLLLDWDFSAWDR